MPRWCSKRATAPIFGQMKIPGLYSYAGFHDFFFKQLGAVAAKLESEHWVMGDAGKQSGVESQFERLGPELLDRYSRDFIASWEGALDNLKLRSISQDKPDYQVLAAAVLGSHLAAAGNCWNRSRPRPR